MNLELLIQKVKENTVIYDVSDKMYTNRNYISSVWRKIARDLDVSEDEVKKKWHQIRSNYMRVKRSLKSKTSEYVARPSPKWIHFDDLSFLDRFTEARYSPANVKHEEVIESSNGKPDNLSDPTLTCENLLSEELASSDYEEKHKSTTSPNSSDRKIFKRKRTDLIDEVDRQSLETNNSTKNCENDPDKMFLLSLLPSIKHLSPLDNLDFRIEIQQILRNKLFPSTEQ